ncbi:MAG TPA: HAD hydrolase-like protein [Anaerolineae bacterium]|nr:HAD hydrolase-like protein [Anaerolineae bacterium]
MLYILDADGTVTPLRGSSTAPFTRELLPGVAEKCARLRAQSHTLALASNQGGARPGRPGRRTIGEVLAQLRWTTRAIGAATFRFAINGARYKPSPAMIHEITAALGFEAWHVTYVGDQESDHLAAIKAGVRFIYAQEFFGKG